VALAFQLLISTELATPRLRSAAGPELGRRVPQLLRKAAIQAIEGLREGRVYEAVLDALPPLPEGVREFAARRFAEVAASPLSYIGGRAGRLKVKTGWGVIGDAYRSMDAFIIPKEYVWYMLEYLTSVEASFKPELVFCGDWECYPLPLALFPSRRLTGLAYDTGHVEPVIELEQKYGAANMAVAISKMHDEIRGVAVAIHPSRRRTRAVIFMKVDRPREVALRLASMQADALEARDELLRRIIGEEYREILSGEDLALVIEEVLREEELVLD